MSTKNIDAAIQTIKDLIAGMNALEDQVNQMKGMFPDDDGAIKESLENADGTETQARRVLAQLQSSPKPRVLVLATGGVAHVAHDVGIEAFIFDVDNLEDRPSNAEKLPLQFADFAEQLGIEKELVATEDGATAPAPG
jgi:hypothetical protein